MGVKHVVLFEDLGQKVAGAPGVPAGLYVMYMHHGILYLRKNNVAEPVRVLTEDDDIAVVDLEVTGTVKINGERFKVSDAQVQTANATPTLLQTIAIPLDKTVLIELRIVAKRTGGTAGSAGDSDVFIVMALAKNVSGIVTLSSVETVYASSGQEGWDVTLDPSGASVLVNVTGAANNNITWDATTFTKSI